jgi:hypothetical protein
VGDSVVFGFGVPTAEGMRLVLRCAPDGEVWASLVPPGPPRWLADAD